MAIANSKMKGLLKGLRYISNIFEAEEKEPEMQIGFPTDVKHVAHVGVEGGPALPDLKTNSVEPLSGNKESSLSPKSPSQGKSRHSRRHHHHHHRSSSNDVEKSEGSRRGRREHSTSEHRRRKPKGSRTKDDAPPLNPTKDEEDQE